MRSHFQAAWIFGIAAFVAAHCLRLVRVRESGPRARTARREPGVVGQFEYMGAWRTDCAHAEAGREGLGDREARRCGVTTARKILLATILAVAGLGCTSSTSSTSYGTPEDCAAAGGQCLTGPFQACAKEGPQNTCNCNPGCNPSGAYCCVELVEAGAAGD
jgi:hypothetical protein